MNEIDYICPMKKESIKGSVIRVVFASDENDFRIVRVDVGNSKEQSVYLNHRFIEQGDFFEFFGVWDEHPVHGRYFKAADVFEILPDTTAGIRSYLASSHFPSIGPVKAGRIVKHFGEDTLSIFETEIDRLTEVKGISEKIKDVIAEKWKSNKEYNEVDIFLQSHKISAKLSGKIIDHYQHNCIAQIKANPYDLPRHIEGIGFKRADQIAISLGFDLNSPLRCESAILYVLSKSGSKGHTYLTYDQIKLSIHELLGQGSEAQVDTLLESLEQAHEIKTRDLGDEDMRYYNKKSYYSERYVARKLKQLNKNRKNYTINEELVDLKNLSDEQRDAVVNASQGGVGVITGGPGVGKTYCTKKLIDILDHIDVSYCLAAPTGKAAKRMRQAIGRDAQTMHRTLEWDSVNGGFLHNELYPLRFKFYVLDETSMVDIHLAAAFLKAVPPNAQIIFLGDVDQLPSVGAGNFFSDMIESGVIDVHRLTKIFRQGTESQIVKFAHQINNQELPIIDSPLENKGLWESDVDCMFIESGMGGQYEDRKDFPTWNSLRYGLNIKQMVEKVYRETIPKYHGNPDDIQVLIPMKKGGVGIIEMNRYLQEKINPPTAIKTEFTSLDRIFRLGDKVIQTRNNYDKNIFNGDVGRIVHIDLANPRNPTIQVNFDDEIVVELKNKDLFDLELAYCLTIHKSQGSEYDYVILPIMQQYGRMLYKQLIYTALTRAKKRAIFIGQNSALEIAVNNADSKKRQSSLDVLLRSEDEQPVESESDLESWGWDKN